jgi:8-oxo-dGTP pyrophosphatase MutT (NUDIX family)
VPEFDQASAVPYRESGGQLEFCLITNRRGRWIFPKGFIDPGETVEQTALKEAWEEAGLQGSIVGSPVGRYRTPKFGAVREVLVLLMQVDWCADQCQESSVRRRVWVPAAEARQLLDRRELRRCLAAAVQRLTGDAPDH